MKTSHEMVIDTYAIVHDYTTPDVPDYAPMLGQSAGLGNGSSSGHQEISKHARGGPRGDIVLRFTPMKLWARFLV